MTVQFLPACYCSDMATPRTTTKGKKPRVIGSERAWDTMRIDAALKTLQKATKQLKALERTTATAAQELERAWKQ